MNTILLLASIFIIIFNAIVQLQSCLVTQRLHIKEVFSAERLAGETSIHTAASKMECASVCLWKSCKSFGMDSENFRCYLYDHYAWFGGKVVERKNLTYYWFYNASCPESYTFNSAINFCYKFKSNKLNSDMALSDCIKDGGLLAMIDSEAKLKIVQQYIMESPTEYIFLGSTDEQLEGRWKWFYGGAVQYWSPSEPDGGRDQNCIEYLRDGLNDVECDALQAYMCEIPML